MVASCHGAPPHHLHSLPSLRRAGLDSRGDKYSPNDKANAILARKPAAAPPPSGLILASPPRLQHFSSESSSGSDPFREGTDRAFAIRLLDHGNRSLVQGVMGLGRRPGRRGPAWAGVCWDLATAGARPCHRRCGPMDKAPAYGAGDSRFESVQW